jgi:hypothetical protein
MEIGKPIREVISEPITAPPGVRPTQPAPDPQPTAPVEEPVKAADFDSEVQAWYNTLLGL